MTTKTTSTKIITKAMTDLLSYAELQDSNDLLLHTKKDTAYGKVCFELWTAFNDYQSAEQAFEKSLDSMKRNIDTEYKSIASGYQNSASWIMLCAENIKKETINMDVAVANIKTLARIRRFMIAENATLVAGV
jgi:hypothetical protein